MHRRAIWFLALAHVIHGSSKARSYHTCHPNRHFRLALVTQCIHTVARVEEHTDRGTKGGWGNVAAELGAHHTAVAVRPRHTAPDHAVLGATHLRSRLVNVGNTLSC